MFIPVARRCSTDVILCAGLPLLNRVTALKIVGCRLVLVFVDICARRISSPSGAPTSFFSIFAHMRAVDKSLCVFNVLVFNLLHLSS